MTPAQVISERLLFPNLFLERPHHFAVQRSTGLPFYVGHLRWESFNVLPTENSRIHLSMGSVFQPQFAPNSSTNFCEDGDSAIR